MALPMRCQHTSSRPPSEGQQSDTGPWHAQHREGSVAQACSGRWGYHHSKHQRDQNRRVKCSPREQWQLKQHLRFHCHHRCHQCHSACATARATARATGHATGDGMGRGLNDWPQFRCSCCGNSRRTTKIATLENDCSRVLCLLCF